MLLGLIITFVNLCEMHSFAMGILNEMMKLLRKP